MKARTWLASSASLIVPLVLGAQQTDSTKKTDSSAAAPPITISGYATLSYTWANNPLDTIIVGRAYDRNYNSFSLNVVNLTVERVAPTDRVSAGFRGELWFGQNAAVVQSIGLDFGPDATIWQAYGVLNLPAGKDHYFQLKAGKMATLLGVEVGEDILNPNLSLGYQDVFLEPFTDTGIELDAKVSSKWDAELRVVNGWDQVTDVNLSKTIVGRLGLTPDDRTLVALTGYFGPEQPGNNVNERTGIDLVASRKLDSAATAVAFLQLDYGQEADAAVLTGGLASWVGAGLWLTYDVVPAATLALRGDYINDREGARTSNVLGFPATTGLKVGSVTATVNIKYWNHALLRPEIRFDRASLPVFDSHDSQFSIGMGLSYIY